MAVAWWLALGALDYGSVAGLWLLNANNGLGNANWNIVSGFSFTFFSCAVFRSVKRDCSFIECVGHIPEI